MLAVARRAIPGAAIDITRRLVTRFGLLVTQPGREITLARRQPGVAAADSSQLVSPGILTVVAL